MFEVFELQDKIAYFDEAVKLFWTQWGSQSNYNFYLDCMMNSCRSESELPRFYLAIQDKTIIGIYALLRNDLISRQDLFPWVACIYVIPELRGNNIGSKLLEHAISVTGKKGYNKLYLCTDLDGYYEKYGWTQLATGYMFNGDSTKIYEFSTC
ncbi:GNAT family N-acetyltransferase [Paenibacillus frigoriresistens]|uniref:GNAT family N-acetyltransferase n=1 Tax=Paenibacillus alginolyticus TaxID=59839 RepID=UPI001564BC89|nr:GNAT family N-acetyltransferase [Paenibacillus frigoriresistens]NRF89856.1 GNAT family N-acetyltransferase [Paenibacillus frigoriresistens]